MSVKVLVVDDDPEIVEVLGILLRLGGHDVLKAYNGKEALELVRSERPDVILLDIMMPGMDGFEVFDELRRDPVIKHIPVIFLTALVQEKFMDKAFRMGASAYIKKPFSRQELLGAIRMATEGVRPEGLVSISEGRAHLEVQGADGVPGRGTIRVFLLCEDQSIVRTVQTALAGTGYGSFLITSGGTRECVQAVRAGSADVILLDFDYGELKGKETMKKLMREPGIRSIIVIVESDEKSVAMEAVPGRLFDYLPRERLEADLLSRSIYYALERQKAQDEMESQMARLGSIVEERTADLRELNRELTEADKLLKKEIEERRRGQEEIERLLRKMLAEEEDIRVSVSRELHDDIAQVLSGLRLQTGSVRTVLANEKVTPEGVVFKLTQIEEGLSHALSRLRHVVGRLRPPLLEHFGLRKAVEEYISAFSSETGVSVESSIEGIPDYLPKEYELQLFRIIQEGLQNVQRHSRTRKASLKVEIRDNYLLLYITDDGRGFELGELESAAGRGHFGLLGMRERAAIMHAKLEIQSIPGKGTTIGVEVPLEYR